MSCLKQECACDKRVICFDCWQAGKRVPGFGLIPRVGLVDGKYVIVEMTDEERNAPLP